MTTKTNETLQPMERTTAGLRDVLFDEIDRMRAGTTNATNANAISRLAAEVNNTLQLEVQMNKFLMDMKGKQIEALAMPAPIALSAR